MYKALKIACEKARPLEEIYVFSDSRSAIQSVTSTGQKTSHYILCIHNLLRQLKESGATVTLVWIPSHCGIAGNECADKLAFEMCLPATTTISYIRNVLSTDEQLHLYRKLWLDEWLTQLKTCQKETVKIRQHTKLLRWHFSTDRKTSIALHRIRFGHNYLNAFFHRIDPEIIEIIATAQKMPTTS